jgi:3-hydroxyisobutyrate dehydrogenase-like beta-hydroxyacid dehydrogenase
MTALNLRRIALIGFGEVGTTLAAGLIATGRHRIAAYDIVMDDDPQGAAMRDKARAMKAETCASAAQAAAGARIVISAVTAASSREVADAAADFLVPGQFFLDLNSVSPATKRASAAAVESAGAHYVEAAVMAPIAPYGLKVPMLLGGRHAAVLKALLDPTGMALEVSAAEIGHASAIKMCRSIMIKGLEALTVECLLAARHYGVEDDIIASLDRSFPQIGWERQAGYLIGRVIQHGRRRAAEMRESADTVAETGLTPLMASAIAARQDWVADQVAANPGLKAAAESAWRETLDRIAPANSERARKAAPCGD